METHENAPPLADELRRIRLGPRQGEETGGLLLTRFIVICPEGASVCIERATEVLQKGDSAFKQQLTG